MASAVLEARRVCETSMVDFIYRYLVTINIGRFSDYLCVGLNQLWKDVLYRTFFIVITVWLNYFTSIQVGKSTWGDTGRSVPLCIK